MNIREWIADSIIYRLTGCAYNKHHDHIFEFIKQNIPPQFFDKNISDFGCGDGGNTLRVQEVFEARKITGYERNKHLVQKARAKKLRIKQIDLNKSIPKGELATLTFALHHLKNPEKVLLTVKNNFEYVFLCEPCNDLYHRLFDAGNPLSRKEWISVFDKVFGENKYHLFNYKNNVVLFYPKTLSAK